MSNLANVVKKEGCGNCVVYLRQFSPDQKKIVKIAEDNRSWYIEDEIKKQFVAAGLVEDKGLMRIMKQPWVMLKSKWGFSERILNEDNIVEKYSVRLHKKKNIYRWIRVEQTTRYNNRGL